MKLIKLKIEDFKSIKKINWNLNQDISCLVGQNESGKSNLLEVIDFLDNEKLKTLSYESHTNRSSDRYLNLEAPLIEAEYKLDAKSKKSIIEKFDPFNVDKEVLNEIKNLERFIIRSKEKNDDSGHYFFEDKDDEYYYPLSYFVPNIAHHPQAVKIIDTLKTSVIKLEDDYIDSFELTVKEVSENTKPNAGLIKLMKLAGVNDLSNIPTEFKSLNRYLKRLNNKLNTSFTKKYYSQDDSVELNIVHNSGKLFLEIADDTEAEYEMNERSDGFKYFFGLLIEAASISNRKTDVIFILDEPGSKLHPSGQKDLLKYLEELSKKYRVIYTTHSPFLINRLFPNRVRVIERDKRNGTGFKFKGFSKNWHPMRSALGLSISDSFYYSEKALIVEGPEDIIYIGAMINLFNNNEEISINADIFSFIDAGGESNLPAMVQIMIEEERPIMVLIDSDSPRTYNKILKKSKSLKSGLLVLNQISDFNEEAVSIEDLLPRELLRESVNRYTDELVSDESISLVKGSSNHLEKISIGSSIYKDSIAPFIRDNYINPSKEPDEWAREKVPISKVGIARHFEKLLNEESFDYNSMKSEFSSFLKLTKTLINKLKLLK